MTDKFVTVIVPTYQDWTRMALCVAALSRQSYSKELFEVIIINNDPGDPAPADFLLPEGFQIITEAKVGSYAARNAGLKIAKGSIIGFTDADCVPDEYWIENAVKHFSNNPGCSRIAGHISIFFKSARPSVAEYYNSVFAFPQAMHAKKGICVTGNLFTYKSVFDAVGPFNESLLSLGDLEWGGRAHKAGFQIQYASNVVVKHPARTLKELIKKERRVGGGQGSMSERSKVRNLLSCFSDIRPRPGLLKHIHKVGNSLDIVSQFKVFLLRHYLIYVRAFEKFRVISGKQPERS